MPIPSNPVLKKLFQDKFFEHRNLQYPLSHSTPVTICTEYYNFIVNNGLKSALEIGTLYGQSTLFLAAATKETKGSVTTVDLRLPKRIWSNGVEIENIHEVAERLISEAGFSDIVTFIEGNSNEVLSNFYREQKKFDFILIDGSHDYPVALIDFIYSDAILSPGGVIALDDIGVNTAKRANFNGGPNRILPMIFSSGRYELIPLNANVCMARKLR